MADNRNVAASAKPGLVSRTRTYLAQVREEMAKVTWPDVPQLRSSTIVILIFVLVVSGIIWLMDVGVRTVLDVIMNLFA